MSFQMEVAITTWKLVHFAFQGPDCLSIDGEDPTNASARSLEKGTDDEICRDTNDHTSANVENSSQKRRQTRLKGT